MCGFVGIFSPVGKNIDRQFIIEMSNKIAHRGPDDDGCFFIDSGTGRHTFQPNGAKDKSCYNLGFGFKRLSVIDITKHARQPMTNHDGSICLVFNGEIYNYLELRASLTNKKRIFASNSDTEVILALYEEFGEAAFSKLNGMFAIALWDQRSNQLFLARDRLGIKPLYYTIADDTLIFASEIKSILSHPGVKKDLDLFGVVEHFNFQYCLNDRTVFDNIKMVNPGSYMRIFFKGSRILKQSTIYWDIKFRPNDKKTADVFAGEIREVLGAVIKRQTRSDIDVGAFLSSGMDAGCICVLAKQILPELNTFTCGFDLTGVEDGLESYFDERFYARELAEYIGSKHHEITLNHECMSKLLPIVMWHLEDPRVGISYQVYAIAKKVKEHVTVVLSGLGGDELFAGYPWRYQKILNILDRKKFNNKYYNMVSRLVDDNSRPAIFSERVMKNLGGFTPKETFCSVMQKCDAVDPLHRALYFDMKGFLPGLLLVDDKLGMACSVETRVPFLDNELLDLAMTIPASLKYNGGVTKLILKKALKGMLPDEVLYRRKQGFTPPDASWFRNFSRPYIESILLSERFFDRGWFRREAINNILMQHFSGEENNRFLIWSLLCFEMLHRQFLDVNVPTPLF